MSTLIVLVNYNGWRDTIECIESLRRLRGEFQVVIVDNGSTDDSLIQLTTLYPEQTTTFDGPPWTRLAALARLHDGAPNLIAAADASEADDDPQPRWLTLIAAGQNLGFAAGNNIGVRYGLARGYQHFWLLNTDVVIAPDALEALLERCRGEPRFGICGSTILYYGRPSIVQCFAGARYLPARSAGRYIGFGQTAPPFGAQDDVERQIGYIVGASLFVSRAFIETVGPMNESYFLYGEEMDWTCRNAGRFKMIYAQRSVVYHKHGGSIGGGAQKASRTNVIYQTRARLFLTWRYFRPHIASVLLFIGLDATKLAVKGRPDLAFLMIWQALRWFFARDGLRSA